MTANEFLYTLEQQLAALPAAERDSAVNYYREYLMEAGEHAPQAIESLGSPQSVAARIISEIGESRAAGASPYMQETYAGFYAGRPGVYAPPPETGSASKTTHLGRTVAVLTLTFPLWFTLLTAWLLLMLVPVTLIGTFAFAAVAAPMQGGMELHSGLGAVGIYDIGAGLLCLGLGMLLWLPLWRLIKVMWKGMGKAIRWCVRALYYGKG